MYSCVLNMTDGSLKKVGDKWKGMDEHRACQPVSTLAGLDPLAGYLLLGGAPL